jgi:tripartite-type tricarboxylate transporter receptor subunit TctC
LNSLRRMIVPFGSGGASDRLARTWASAFSEVTGTRLIVDNMPGEGGRSGARAGAMAAADGATLLFGTSTTQCIAAALWRNPGYRPIGDFAPVVLLGDAPNVLCVAATQPYRSVADVIAAARAAPGMLSYASAGFGQTIHLCGALFAALTATDLVHREFARGSMLAYPDLLAGRATMMFDNVLACLPDVRDGKLRALAVTGDVRSSCLPDVPTMEEAGVAGFGIDLWLGILAPAAVPHGTLRSLVGDGMRALARCESSLLGMGLQVAGLGPEAFRDRICGGVPQWSRVLATCGISAR